MIIVKVELHSAITKEITLLGKLHICNDGTGTNQRGNYDVFLYRKNGNSIVRRGKVLNHTRLTSSIFRLVYKAIKSVFANE